MIHMSEMSEIHVCSYNFTVFFRLIKHISMHEWRRRTGEKEINPSKLSKAEGEKAFCPHWAPGAVDALHEAAESYLVGSDGRCQPPHNPCQEVHNSTQIHPVSPPYSWRQRLGQVRLQWPILSVNCFYFYFVHR